MVHEDRIEGCRERFGVSNCNLEGITAGADGPLWFAEHQQDRAVHHWRLFSEYPVPTVFGMPRASRGPDSAI